MADETEKNILQLIAEGKGDVTELHKHLIDYVDPKLVETVIDLLLVVEPCEGGTQTVHSKAAIMASAAAALAHSIAELVEDNEDLACILHGQCVRFSHDILHMHFAAERRMADKAAHTSHPEDRNDGPEGLDHAMPNTTKH